MEAKLTTFAMLLFFCLCNRGDGTCSVSDLEVTQISGRGQIGGYQKIYVKLENRCICTQSNVKLWCPGFEASIHVDPAGFIRPVASSENCTLNGGGPLRNGDVIKFSYVWSTMFSFAPLSSSIACS